MNEELNNEFEEKIYQHIIDIKINQQRTKQKKNQRNGQTKG